MSDEVNKVRTWFKTGGEDLHFPAWAFTIEEIQAMKIADLVRVHGEKYKIHNTVFDTADEAMIFELVKA